MPRVGTDNGKRGWWRAFFFDHPASAQKDSDAFMGTGTSAKLKVYCQKCFDEDLTTLRLRDETDISAGRRVHVRSNDELTAALWAVEGRDTGRGWLRSAPSTLLNHLRKCTCHDADTRARATADHIDIYGGASNSPKKRRSTRGQRPNLTIDSTSYLAVPQVASSVNAGLAAWPQDHGGPVVGSSISAGSQVYSLNSPVAAGSLSLPPAMGSPLLLSPLVTGTPPSLPPSTPSSLPDIRGLPSIAPTPTSGSLPTSPAVLSLGIGHNPPHQLSQQQLPAPRPLSRHFILPEWTSTQQKRFERRISRLTASAGLPFAWVDNPEWIALCDEFIPGAKIPSQRTLARRLIPEAVCELRAGVKEVVRGRETTVQADGWTGINNHHLIAFMVMADRKVYTVRVHDASMERKTAENLLYLLEDVLKTVEQEWGGVIVAVVTDASGESRKARRLLGEKHPSLVVLDCYAHQINLIVGDYFKNNTQILEYTDQANELITWLRSKTMVLALVREAQLAAENEAVAVIRAVLTRWTAHYLAYSRLLKLRQALVAVVSAEELRAHDKKKILTGDSRSKKQAIKMMARINDKPFWRGIIRITRHLEHLAIAANVTQMSFCAIYTVLLTFAYLVMNYRRMGAQDPEDLAGCCAIINSIEKRWEKCDQEIFIAAVVLNPFYKTAPFANLICLNNAGIHALLEHLYVRFFRTQPPPEFDEQVSDYLHGRGSFVHLSGRCERARTTAERKGDNPDPLAVFDEFCFAGCPPPAFITLAKRILSISANSASCERLFSVFGAILTKLRNRLGTDTLQSLAELKMHIRDEHMKQETKERTKRRFGAPSKAPAAENSFAPNRTSREAPSSPLADPTHSHIEPDNTGIPRSSPDSHLHFRGIVEQNIALLDEDALDDAPVRQSTCIGQRIPIRELFDFTKDHWTKVFSSAAVRSFDEELALHELLDLDAEGDEDFEVDLDGTTQDVLLG